MSSNSMSENSGLLRSKPPKPVNRLQRVSQNVFNNLRQQAGIIGDGINRISDTISNTINSTGVFDNDPYEEAYENGYIGINSYENQFHALEEKLYDEIYQLSPKVEMNEMNNDINNQSLPVAKQVQNDEDEEEEEINEDESIQDERNANAREEIKTITRRIKSKINSVNNMEISKLKDIKLFLNRVEKGYSSDKTLKILRDIDSYIS